MFILNLLTILFAGIISALIGFVWYHPRVFGGAWMRLSSLTPEVVERGKRRMHADEILALLASILAAFVLFSLETKLGIYDARGAVQLGLLAWAGFVVPALSGTVLWEQRPISLYIINVGYWLVAFVTMAVIVIL
ncbi:MAG: DUF1761 domain-containing protein [bacterium]|nr:DUF1761 domain-containing protein [bacterium]